MNVPIWLGLEQVYQQFLLALVSLSSENNKRKNNLIFSFIAITQLFRLDKENVLDPFLRDDLARTGRPLGISFIVIGIFSVCVYTIFSFPGCHDKRLFPCQSLYRDIYFYCYTCSSLGGICRDCKEPVEI